MEAEKIDRFLLANEHKLSDYGMLVRHRLVSDYEGYEEEKYGDAGGNHGEI